MVEGGLLPFNKGKVGYYGLGPISNCFSQDRGINLYWLKVNQNDKTTKKGHELTAILAKPMTNQVEDYCRWNEG